MFLIPPSCVLNISRFPLPPFSFFPPYIDDMNVDLGASKMRGFVFVVFDQAPSKFLKIDFFCCERIKPKKNTNFPAQIKNPAKQPFQFCCLQFLLDPGCFCTHSPSFCGSPKSPRRRGVSPDNDFVHKIIKGDSGFWLGLGTPSGLTNPLLFPPILRFANGCVTSLKISLIMIFTRPFHL